MYNCANQTVTKMRKKLNIQEIGKYYEIGQDGRIWSNIRHRWMKPIQNNCHYIHVYITKGVEAPLWVFIHTLVALKYIGEPPTDKHEINHKDNNRANNHYTNLEWVTKSENHLLAYKNGKDHYWLNKHRPSPSIETLMLMANAKKKKVLYTSESQRIVYDSIEEAASRLVTYRKKIYSCIKTVRSIQGGYLTHYHDQADDKNIG